MVDQMRLLIAFLFVAVAVAASAQTNPVGPCMQGKNCNISNGTFGTLSVTGASTLSGGGTFGGSWLGSFSTNLWDKFVTTPKPMTFTGNLWGARSRNTTQTACDVAWWICGTPTNGWYDQMQVVAEQPAGSNLIETHAYGAYISNSSTSVNNAMVGYHVTAKAVNNGSQVWGWAAVFEDCLTAGACSTDTGKRLIGMELDFNTENAATTLDGIMLVMRTTHTLTSPAVAISTSVEATSLSPWTTSFQSNSGAASNAFLAGMTLSTPGVNTPSQPYMWETSDATSTARFIRVTGAQGYQLIQTTTSTTEPQFSTGRLQSNLTVDVPTLSGVIPQVQVEEGPFVAEMLDRATNDAVGPTLLFRKTRAGTPTGITIVHTGDSLGNIRFGGTDGATTNLQNIAAQISAIVEGTPVVGTVNAALVFATGASEAMRLTTGSNLLLGVPAATPLSAGLTARIQSEDNGSLWGAALDRATNDNVGASFAFRKTRAVTPSGITAVQNGDSLGGFRWIGTDGVNTNAGYTTALIRAVVDGTVASNSVPGDLEFYAAENLQMSILGVGGVIIGPTKLVTTSGALGLNKIAASGSAPGAAGGKLELVCGTGAGTAKLIVYAGTSTTPSTIVDNIGGSVTGC